MNEDKDKITNIISVPFEQKGENRPITCKEVFQNQSNPIYKNLFKLVHSQLNSADDPYKSFSKFKPKDLK